MYVFVVLDAARLRVAGVWVRKTDAQAWLRKGGFSCYEHIYWAVSREDAHKGKFFLLQRTLLDTDVRGIVRESRVQKGKEVTGW